MNKEPLVDVSGRDESPYAAQGRRLSFLRGIYQAIACEETCPRDEVSQEDYIFDRLLDLMDDGQLTSEDAQDAFNAYISYTRPDTHVINVREDVRGAFYE